MVRVGDMQQELLTRSDVGAVNVVLTLCESYSRSEEQVEVRSSLNGDVATDHAAFHLDCLVICGDRK